METSSVGIDVSKANLDVCVLPSKERFCFSNNETGVKELRARLTRFKEAIVVLEATGGLESYAAAALGTAGFKVAIVNPRQVRDFARALGRLAKCGQRNLPRPPPHMGRPGIRAIGTVHGCSGR